MNPAKSLLLLLTALLAGCAVISEEACQAGLWYERGLQDGARGRGQSLVYDIARQCREYGVRVDTEAWLRGHEEGVAYFCTPENGYRQGRLGNSYEGVCTGPGADLFLAEYHRGLADYQVEMEYLQLARRYDDLRRQLIAVNAALASAGEEEQIRALQLHRSALRRELDLLDLQLRGLGFVGFSRFY
ncbi:DUF2799 domain-containing protein [Microbulbifer thermotolerans]|uniref:DUF2799 domain-containing protein n=1 Tax=Microbulbifer thermotolerans TaxID=252514 RepID=UPI00224A9259|nr:DUF2799 domain-containing protein [Microbulbifer thermotolerans]MCX2781206.1 DUF2799 domain-containing protein [Microbulbifer thermotolerans]MCX2803476.1 DUF2799 domain-containing protein [Microbulbifer thermotolerans]